MSESMVAASVLIAGDGGDPFDHPLMVAIGQALDAAPQTLTGLPRP